MARKISQEQLGVYKKYRGDDDGFARSGRPSDRALMAGVNWKLIGEAIQRASLIEAGHATKGFEVEFNELLRETFEDGIDKGDLARFASAAEPTGATLAGAALRPLRHLPSGRLLRRSVDGAAPGRQDGPSGRRH